MFFDIETTGLEPCSSEILVIAAQITDLEGNPIGSHFESLVKPHKNIPLKVNRISGISLEMVKDAPDFALVAAKFKKIYWSTSFGGPNRVMKMAV